jgi:hypothetical protein
VGEGGAYTRRARTRNFVLTPFSPPPPRGQAGQAATLGTRTITLSAGQTTPFECRSDGEVVTVTLVGSFPTPSALPTRSETMTPLPTPSLSPTPLGEWERGAL